MIDPNILNQFTAGMTEEMQAQGQPQGNPYARRFSGRQTGPQMAQAIFRGNSPMQQWQRGGIAGAENFIYQNRPEEAMTAIRDSRPPSQFQSIPLQQMSQEDLEAAGGNAYGAPQQSQGPTRMPQQAPQQQPRQRVLNSEQRQQYNQMRRDEGQDAARQFRMDIKKDMGLGRQKRAGLRMKKGK